MTAYPEWKLGLDRFRLVRLAIRGAAREAGSEEIGFDSLDLFIGFDPGRMDPGERRNYVADVRSVDLPINSLVCTCLGLSDFNPAVRSYHIERAKNVLDLASEFSSARNLCFVPGEYMFQHHLRAGGERVEARGRRYAARSDDMPQNGDSSLRSNCFRSSSPSSKRWTIWSVSWTTSV